MKEPTKAIAVYGSIFLFVLTLFGIRALLIHATAGYQPLIGTIPVPLVDGPALVASVGSYTPGCGNIADPNEHFEFFNDEIHALSNVDTVLCR